LADSEGNGDVDLDHDPSSFHDTFKHRLMGEITDKGERASGLTDGKTHEPKLPQPLSACTPLAGSRL
jgi:hypothetical protein